MAGQVAHDARSVSSSDGTATQIIDVTVNGSNDNATIGGTATGAVTKAGGVNNGTAGTPAANGTLTVTDVDAGQAFFATPPSLAGTYGTFTFNTTTGAWTYALDNTRVATQGLIAGQTVHDTLSVSSSEVGRAPCRDGTVTGSNDNASNAGTETGTVTEAGGVNNGAAGTPTANGTLTVTDVDAGQAVYATPSSLAGTYVSFTFNTTTGAWTYSLDNTRAATQGLVSGQTVHDTLSVSSSDGTATQDRKSTRLNSSHFGTSYAAVCVKNNKAGGVNNGTAGTPTAT